MTKTIEDILKDMPLEDSVKKSLEESWNTALADAKVAQEANIHADLREQYDTDLANIKSAMGQFLEDRIKPHVAELKEGIDSVDSMKARYAKRIAEVKAAAKSSITQRMAKLESMMNNRLREELSELHEDVVANRKAALNAVNEAKAKSEADQINFRTKAAKVLEHIINVKLPKQLDPLREDIEAARQDNFGREIFEAFQMIYRRQFFNTSGEFKSLVNENKKLKASEALVKRQATKAIKESRKAAFMAKQKHDKLTESIKRKQVMQRLLKPLKGNAREQMNSLLEATKTDKLESTFRKALPQLARSKSKAPQVMNEARRTNVAELRTGNHKPQLVESDYDAFDDELDTMRRLAGNKQN